MNPIVTYKRNDYTTVEAAAAEIGVSARRMQQIVAADQLASVRIAGVIFVSVDAINSFSRGKVGRPATKKPA